MTRHDAVLAPVTPRRILALALPMTLSQVTTPLLGLTGAATVGHLGDPALLGAVALGAVLFDLVFWTFGSLRLATAGLTAQATGAGNLTEADLILLRALSGAILAGLAVVVLQWPIRIVAFPLLGASAAVGTALSTYFSIRILAAPFTLANYAILGAALGRGRSDLGLLLQVVVNGTNIVLTILLVTGLGWGIAGAAAGALGAEALGVPFGLFVLARVGARPWRVGRASLLDRRAVLRMLAVNRDVMIRSAVLMTAFTVFASRGARAGDTVLAANEVLFNIFALGSYGLDGIAAAAEILCGQAVGAGAREQFRRAAALSVRFALGFGALVSAGFLLGGVPFIAAVSTSEAVRATARDFLPYAALSPFAGAAAFAFDGIFVGATWTPAMRNLMLAAVAAYLLVVWAAAPWGNHGLWIALLAFMACRAFGQAWAYPRLLRRTFSPPLP